MDITIGLLSVALAFISYGLYFRAIRLRRTKPHGITWLIWAGLNGFIFWQQLLNDAGAGAWVTGIAAVANIIIFLLAFRYGEHSVTRLDWVCLAAAGAMVLLWTQGASEELTIILACLIFIAGFAPTFRKSFSKPSEETLPTYALNSLKFFLALVALESFTIVTALYPLTLAILNGSFVIFLLVRRAAAKWHKKGGHRVHAHRS